MRGAIFDVDGTLLDSMQVWWDVVVDFFKEHGVELPYEEAKEYKASNKKNATGSLFFPYCQMGKPQQLD